VPDGLGRVAADFVDYAGVKVNRTLVASGYTSRTEGLEKSAAAGEDLAAALLTVSVSSTGEPTMSVRWLKSLLLPATLMAFLAAVAPPAHGQQATTVLVVRHAEKQWEDGDPPLSDVGWQRAEDLLRVVGESGVSVLFGTQYKRTSQTLEPIAERFVLEILVHDAGDSEGLAERILTEHEGHVVLVSGHSNTVPEIVAALGAPEPDPIGDAEYDNLHVVSVGAGGGEATVLHLHFGLPAEAP